MPAVLLVAYLLLGGVAVWRARSLTWAVVLIAAAVSLAGIGVGLGIELGLRWTFLQLQIVLLVALLAAAVIAWFRPVAIAPRRRSLLAVGLPSLLLIVFIVFVTVVLTEKPGFLTPVGFLIGHANAEDNAKWLDFTSAMASGLPIDQAVPMGGPLQLFLVFVGTLMAVVSQVALGGINQVAVAGNTVVYGELLLACIAPLALAPIVEARFRTSRLPVPLVWAGVLPLVAASFVVTGYGHMTLQFTFIVAGLWAAVFLADLPVRRIALLASVAFAAAGTVWLPLNVLAVVVLVGWLVVLIRKAVRGGRRALDIPGLIVVVAAGIGLAGPLLSSIAYTVGIPLASGVGNVGSTPMPGGGGGTGRGIGTSVPALFSDGALFASAGGTDQVGPVLAVLTAVSLLGAVSLVTLVTHRGRWVVGRRFLPITLLLVIALAIALLDFWFIGSGPGYGSKKFAFMTAIVTLAVTLPVALGRLDWPRHGMTALRWAGAGAVVALLVLDSLLPRAVAAVRPEQWSPPIPFSNPKSYWWPAEVNGTADQPIAASPLGCVYLPQGAAAPSAILDSQLSDPQRVYSCSRILAGLTGGDFYGQAYVDWLRREWLTNTRAWSDIRGYLADMPEWIRSKPVILLDDGSNVIGLETVNSLLDRFPAQPSP